MNDGVFFLLEGDAPGSIGESSVPRDIFCHFNTVYEEAGKVSIIESTSSICSIRHLLPWTFGLSYTLSSLLLQGNYVSDLGHTIFNQSFLGSRDHGGFLYVRPTFQCLQKIPLPKEPNFIFGILLQKWETPWAKVSGFFEGVCYDRLRFSIRGRSVHRSVCPMLFSNDEYDVIFNGTGKIFWQADRSIGIQK